MNDFGPRRDAPLTEIQRDILAIRQSAFWLEREFASELRSTAPVYQHSVCNLLHYMALRRRDIRPLQRELARLGLSSLGRAESHVLANLFSARRRAATRAAGSW